MITSDDVLNPEELENPASNIWFVPELPPELIAYPALRKMNGRLFWFWEEIPGFTNPN